MPLGVLEDTRLGGKVPGTVAINELASTAQTFFIVGKKTGKGRHANVVLAPQPSNDPNDPLNWPRWRKELSMYILTAITVVIGCVWIMLSPGQGVIAEEFDVSLTEVSKSTGAHILVIGFSSFFTSAFATKFGKRPVFIVCAIILLVTNIWGATAKSWSSLFAARAIMGVGVAPFETIVTAWVADVFFVHERATRNSIWNMALSCGSSLGAVVGGYIIQYLSWRWTFGFCAVSMGVLTPALILFVPESVYKREAEFETDLVATSAGQYPEDDGGGEEKAEPDVSEGVTSESPAVSTRGQPIPEPKTFVQLIAPCDGVKSEDSFFKLLLRPVKMGIYPSVIWAYLTYSCGVTWLALFGVTQAQIFSQAPYNFSAGAIGLTSLGGCITAILGSLTAGPLCDWIALKMAAWNNGIYEPEFRIPLIIPGTIFTIAGLWGFGLAVDAKTPWALPVVLNGINFLGLIWTAIPVYGYIIDSHRQHAAHAFVMVNLVKAIASYVLTFHANTWYEQQGPKNMFFTVGGVQLFGQLTTIIVYVFGKRLRSFVERKQWLKNI